MSVPVPLGDRSYQILIGENLLQCVAELAAQHAPAHRYAIITDSIVGPLYGPAVVERLGGESRCSLFDFTAGEKHKNRGTWQELTDAMLAAGFGRDTAVLALGGGVVGDLAGFVAATFLRGVPYVQVPTSLLAMIDSSVGGKTGVDTAHGKNLVGAFHQPAVVITDVTTLNTLPRRHVCAGLAEAVKHGAIADAQYLQQLVSQAKSILDLDPSAVIQIVQRSVEIKAHVVAQDERESGKRAVLNFGHTIGHGLEASSRYDLLHGEAVAIGMLAEAAIGTGLGITDEAVPIALRETISQLQIPVARPSGLQLDELLQHMEQDKKKRDGSVRFALPARLGEMARDARGDWTHLVPRSVIRSAWDLST
ncbi:MAG: 3-dehydroquinate synthase [Gemmatimonadota bacterium]|nr:MAG: 3-dehydroquinate synthase [Gemmatimonadota bacterium]